MEFLKEEFVLDVWYPNIIEYELQGLVGRYKHKTRKDITRMEIYKTNIENDSSFSAYFYIRGNLIKKYTTTVFEEIIPVLEKWARAYCLNIFFGGYTK